MLTSWPFLSLACRVPTLWGGVLSPLWNGHQLQTWLRRNPNNLRNNPPPDPVPQRTLPIMIDWSFEILQTPHCFLAYKGLSSLKQPQLGTVQCVSLLCSPRGQAAYATRPSLPCHFSCGQVLGCWLPMLSCLPFPAFSVMPWCFRCTLKAKNRTYNWLMASDCTRRDIISLQGLLLNRASSSVMSRRSQESFNVWVCLHTPTKRWDRSTVSQISLYSFGYFINFFKKWASCANDLGEITSPHS